MAGMSVCCLQAMACVSHVHGMPPAQVRRPRLGGAARGDDLGAVGPGRADEAGGLDEGLLSFCLPILILCGDPLLEEKL